MVKKQSPNAWPQGAHSVAAGIRHEPVVKEEQNLAAGNTLKITKYQNACPRTSLVQWKNSSSNAAAAAAAAKLLQSCPILCDPINGSPSGSTIPGILQARTLEWVAIYFSNA